MMYSPEQQKKLYALSKEYLEKGDAEGVDIQHQIEQLRELIN